MSSTPTVPVTSPIKLLDVLMVVTDQEKHGTPRPSVASMLFINGLQSMELGNWPKAKESLMKSMAEAEKPTATKIELATTLLGVGYLLVVQPQRDIDKSKQAYSAALTLWEQINGDVAALCTTMGAKEEAITHLERAASLLRSLEKHPETIPQTSKPITEYITLEAITRIIAELKQSS